MGSECSYAIVDGLVSCALGVDEWSTRRVRRCTRPSGPCRVGPRREGSRRRRQYLVRPTNTTPLTPDGSLTAFALNSVVYPVPLAMVPSSPIKLEEIRNKNQFISAEIERRTGLTATLNHYRRTLTTLDNVDDFNPATFHALCQRIEITPNGKATVIWKDGTNPPEQ